MSEPTVRFIGPPVDGPITQNFGEMFNPYPHRGTDFGVRVGTTVIAPAAGKVVAPFNDGSFGIAVCLDHGDGWFSLYAHLSRANVSVGDSVKPEQIIGYSGNTGYSTGPHLHWQLSDSPTFPIDFSRSRDPMKYIQKEDEMTAEERAKLDAVYAALSGGLPNVIEDWNKNGNSLLLGFANEQGRLSDHIATHGGGTGIPEHKHEAGKVVR